ncbi:MAG TPA: hypothetical protein VF509_05950 [Sphingobium sp.]
MFIIAMIVIGLASAALFGLIGLGLYISIMEPAGPGEQAWQQGDIPRRRADGEGAIAVQRRGIGELDRDGQFTRVPHA